jgi:heparanase 1
VVDFSDAVGSRIVTSFAVSPGTRGATGIWVPDQALRFLAYTRMVGGTIAAAEFMNEPNLAEAGGTLGSGAARYGRDFEVFHSFVKQNFPEILVLGPGTVGNTADVSDLFVASGSGRLDAISYHYYGKLSERCGAPSAAETALSEEWLLGTDQTLTFYRALRDQFEPGKPIWLTEQHAADTAGPPPSWIPSDILTSLVGLRKPVFRL